MLPSIRCIRVLVHARKVFQTRRASLGAVEAAGRRIRSVRFRAAWRLPRRGGLVGLGKTGSVGGARNRRDGVVEFRRLYYA